MSKQTKVIWGIGIVVVIIGVVSFFLSRPYVGDKNSTQVGGLQTASSGSMQKIERFAMEDSLMVMDEGVQTMSAPAVDGEVEAQERLIVKTGSISLLVENVRSAIEAVSAYAESHDGFVVTSEYNKYEYGPYGTVTIRIPADMFDSGVEDVRAFGEVTSQRVNGQDVTEEYVDLDAQLSNLRATENQFLEILKQAREIDDVLAVQSQLSYVRERIDRIEGRMKYLRESAAMSTLTVHLSADPNNLPVLDEGDTWKPLAVVKNAARSLVYVGQAVVNAIIWMVVYIPVWLVIGGTVWWVVRLLRKRV